MKAHPRASLGRFYGRIAEKSSKNLDFSWCFDQTTVLAPKFRARLGTQRGHHRTQGHQTRAGTSFGHPPGPRKVWLAPLCPCSSYLKNHDFGLARPTRPPPRGVLSRKNSPLESFEVTFHSRHISGILRVSAGSVRKESKKLVEKSNRFFSLGLERRGGGIFGAIILVHSD